MTAEEKAALEYHAITSIKRSPTGPGERQESLQRAVDKTSKVSVALKLGWSVQQLDEVLSATPLEEHDRFDAAASQAVVENCENFTEYEVYRTLGIDVVRAESPHLICYASITDKGFRAVGRTTRVPRSEDEEFRTLLAGVEVRYTTPTR